MDAKLLVGSFVKLGVPANFFHQRHVLRPQHSDNIRPEELRSPQMYTTNRSALTTALTSISKIGRYSSREWMNGLRCSKRQGLRKKQERGSNFNCHQARTLSSRIAGKRGRNNAVGGTRFYQRWNKENSGMNNHRDNIFSLRLLRDGDLLEDRSE